MGEALRPLAGHAVFLLLVQVALILLAARMGSEVAKRFGLPAVVGELAAGILLGPSVFGHYSPGFFAAIFPHDSAQFHLLDVVGTLGMVLLLLLTGLETDLRLLRNLGRAAFISSLTGMVLPFAMGFGLGWMMPAQYLAQPDHRTIFSLFLATAMSISAMPVIAKILMDLDLAKRNIGLVILSAGVVDDTAGWLILSLIAGAASHGTVEVTGLLKTVGLMFGFLLASGLVLYPVLRVLIRVANEGFKSEETDLVLIVMMTLLCAAATEWIGIHAVFGAFVCGTVFRQVPRLREETVHKLESFVFAILAPVFFGIVGLKVNLWTLGGGGGQMLAIVLAVACGGKLVGCTVGSLWGGLRFWEAFSIAVAMNARGAMELVVATIGLSLGILNQQMFSIIVVVAVVTSFMAPLGLRLTMRRVRMTEDEERRIRAEESKGAFDPEKLRVLVPTSGGVNAPAAAQIAFMLAKKSADPVQIVYINPKVSWWDRLLRRAPPAPTGEGIDAHVALLQSLAVGAKAPRVRKAAGTDVSGAIIEEANKGYDLIVIGASQRGSSMGGRTAEAVVREAPCHVAIARSAKQQSQLKNVLVPIDGSIASRVAAELAVRYAEPAGATLTLALLTERPVPVMLHSDMSSPSLMLQPRQSAEQELERISTVFKAAAVQPKILKLGSDPQSSAVSDEIATGKYDLIVIGAENRAIQNRLYFGHDNEQLIRTSTATVLIVVPNLGRLSA